MSSDSHMIGQVSFDLGFFSVEKNHELQETVSRLFNSEISRKIDLLFSDAIAGDEVLQIKQLSLDLGDINYSDLEKELPERIIASLKEKIAGFKNQRPGEAGNYKLLDSKRYKLNTIEHYLLTGNLLRKDTDIHSGIESYLADLLTEDPSLLIKLLKKTGKKERARMRIAWQFREKTILSIINALEPAYRQVISDYTRQLELTESPVTTVQAQSEDFKRAKYFFALTYLFVEKGSVFNTRNFVRSLMKQLSAHYNMSYREFLLLMRRQIRQSPGTFSKGLELYIREIFLEDFELSDKVTGSDEEEAFPDVASTQADAGDQAEECLFFFLENGSMPLRSGNMPLARLQDLFLSLIKTRPQQVKDFIRRQRTENAMLIMSRFFSDKAIQALIGLYAPAHSEWIWSLSNSLVRLESLAELFEDKRLLKSQLHRAVLGQLVASAGNTFHKASFLEHLLSSLPVNSGRSIGELNARIKSGFEQSGETEYSALLGAVDIQKPNSDSNSENDGAMDSALSSKQMEANIAELQPAHSPWILSVKNLLLKAQSHFAIIATTHRTYAETEIGQLIYKITQNYTKAIFDRRDFFNQVLQSLAEKSTSDRPEFIANAKTAMDKAGGEAYSSLIDPDLYSEKLHKTSGKNKELNPKEELSAEEAIISTIQKWQPEHSDWILSLHRVMMAAHAFFPFAAALHKSAVRPDLYQFLLQATESYPHPVFDKSHFFTHLLILISRRSPLDIHTFLREAKKAISHSSATSYAGLIHSVPAANDVQGPDKKEIIAYPYADQSLTERQELDSLLYFLSHGESPWWSGIQDEQHLKYFWQKHFRTKKKKRLLSFIKSHITDEPIRKHLLFFLEDDLANNTLSLGNRKNENALLSKLIPHIRRNLTSKSSEAFVEAYIIYSFQKKEKKQELIWADIQTLFAARGISISGFYTELLTLQDLFSDLYLDGFFLLFHSRLPGQLSLRKTSGEHSRDENRISSPDNPQDKHEPKRPSPNRKETDPEKEHDDSAGEHSEKLPKVLSTDQAAQRPAEKETLRYLELLLHFLNTGIIPESLDLSSKELILKVLSGIHRVRNHANTRLLYLSLKNELLFKRFIAAFDATEQEKLMRAMFPDEYAFLAPYLSDFVILFSNRNLKRQVDKDLVLLRSATFLFLIEYFHKNTGVSEYIRFVAKRMFQSVAEYHTFSGLTKLAILRKDMPLQTFLPSMLLAMMRQEKKKEDKKEKPIDEIRQGLVFIENAGLILLWPFMSFYFEKLGLVSDRKFTSVKAAIRGACLLQYLVTGVETRQEHELPLNKVLCQLPKNHPVYNIEAFTREEKDLSDELLKTAISRWEIIKNTSIEGLRNTFLKREGKLEWQDDKIILTVEPKSFDMLVDKIPWNISVIKLPWMKHTLHVKWR